MQAERRRLGEAARAEAERRFTLRHFETALLRAYGFGGKPARPAEIRLVAAHAAAPRAASSTSEPHESIMEALLRLHSTFLQPLAVVAWLLLAIASGQVSAQPTREVIGPETPYALPLIATPTSRPRRASPTRASSWCWSWAR